MARQRFERLMNITKRYEIRPILAVVPDNRDPELIIDKLDPQFWARMRDLESGGATIALHGFRHVCQSRGRSYLGLHAETEFAGVREERQAEWIRSGLETLRQHGLSPRLFVAPRHGFDSSTLRALVDVGMPFLSDGFASRPFTRRGVVWIPQQLWEPIEKSHGLWTICLHTNTASIHLEDKLAKFLDRFADQFTTFDEVTSTSKARELYWNERVRQALTAYGLRLKRA